ncbi:PQQ-dependent dehydrogenase, methanol/ethanol family [Marinicaulis flavus]|uniref:PQQ-dependent dehydrogenase, methanol/ethanol family n=2 Tax=Hyphococcus luteus TaxID=2058213 RepID=A0A2S7K3G9_9PROT|nr:PQQ-dependent dehydrogenase, methanol/ethanol family [Marinicaulis flavus]
MAALLSGCGGQDDANEAPDETAAETAAEPALETGEQPAHANVNAARLLYADENPGQWMSHGRTYSEQRYSPLDDINTGNVSRLGLAWHQDLDTNRGQEATPLVIDGVMYVTTAWSKVKAYDAATGEELWAYDPQVPGEWAVHACCDVVNRGLAAWNGKLYLGTLDGRLVALDAETGEEVWSKVTIDRSKPYTITGAPRIVKGKVLIGNGGAEFGVRGYVTAYDAETGKIAWRFYTVPGDPAKGFENEAMAVAAQTWNGEWWKLGGGGTVWDSMAYDPDTDLLYIGVGNGSPWNQSYRSPGGGDNLFLSSIVALDPDTGEYVWHFQTTPGETWDFTATQQIIVATLEIDGAPRKVVMQAPKNGFFYVLDAKTGEFISANNITDINWATGVDPETGRPIENPQARFDETGKPFVVSPGPGGAHSWHPMSYNPETGLVYIPVNIGGFPYAPDPNYEPEPRGFNNGVNFAAAALPADPNIKAAVKATVGGRLVAWDPVAQKEVWGVPYPGAGNGGTVTTAGGLVFQGTKFGEFAAYDAASGDKLWSMDAQTGIVAAPVTYEIDGKQYVAVLAGWGGVEALAPGELGAIGSTSPNYSRVLVFKIGGTDSLPPKPQIAAKHLAPPPLTASAETVSDGAYLYARYCGVCHGDAAHSAGVLPDLRLSDIPKDPSQFADVVLGGALSANGMVSFTSVLDADSAEKIRAYIIARANEDLKYQEESSSGQ